MSAFSRKRGDVTTCSQYTPKSQRFARSPGPRSLARDSSLPDATDHEFAIGHESRLFRRRLKSHRVKHGADCSANNSANGAPD